MSQNQPPNQPLPPDAIAAMHDRLATVNGLDQAGLEQMAVADVLLTVKLAHRYLAGRSDQDKNKVPPGIESALLRLYPRLRPPESQIAADSAVVKACLSDDASRLKLAARDWARLSVKDRHLFISQMIDRQMSAFFRDAPNRPQINLVLTQEPVITLDDGTTRQSQGGLQLAHYERGTFDSPGKITCTLEINAAAANFDDLPGLVGTISHELTHARQLWTYYEAVEQRIGRDHPGYAYAHTIGENFAHYRRESQALYFAQPIEAHAFAIGRAATADFVKIAKGLSVQLHALVIPDAKPKI